MFLCASVSLCVACALPILLVFCCRFFLHDICVCNVWPFCSHVKAAAAAVPGNAYIFPWMKRQRGKPPLSVCAVENSSKVGAPVLTAKKLKKQKPADIPFRSCTVISEEGANLKNAACPNCQTIDKAIV